jgi:cytochrome c biogenesis protein CcdA/thiol-disulfide isomerase/thioredoxin
MYLVAFIGGLLAIVSPCILPVLPFVFARADQPFRRNGLPLLAGMAVTFAVVGTFATVAGGWVVRANQYGRTIAMIVVAVFGLALIFPALADLLSRPFVRIGGFAQRRADGPPSPAGSLLLGVSTGLLWTPCAGPILGLILAAAAAQGASARGAGLLVAFALGSASALALALLAGNRVFAAMKRTLGAERVIRTVLGVAVLVGVAGIAEGWDTGVLARMSLSPGRGPVQLEQSLADRIRPFAMPVPANDAEFANERPMPSLDGAVQWLNSPPLTREELRGKVVVIDFWTYSCINCLRALPYVQAWADKYKASGLVVIGVHSPEFAFERATANVAAAVKDLKISYPVAVDSNLTIWNAFDNQYWPAHYFVDADGRVRHHHFGEGNYDESERVIQTLLAERNKGAAPADLVQIAGTGVEAPSNAALVSSPETYVGYEREEHFASPQPIARDHSARYTAPATPLLNQWGLAGQWTVGDEQATLASGTGKIVFRFHARDLHLVLGPGGEDQPVRFRVTLDGGPPLDDKGMDVDRDGNGTITDYRLYQLIRQTGEPRDRTFVIEFFGPGVEAFAFTFG